MTTASLRINTSDGNMLLIDNIFVVEVLFLARVAGHSTASSRTRRDHCCQRPALTRLDALQMALVLLLGIASVLLIDEASVNTLDKAIRRALKPRLKAFACWIVPVQARLPCSISILRASTLQLHLVLPWVINEVARVSRYEAGAVHVGRCSC